MGGNISTQTHTYLFMLPSHSPLPSPPPPRDVKGMPDLGKSVKWPEPPPVLATFLGYAKQIHARLGAADTQPLCPLKIEKYTSFSVILVYLFCGWSLRQYLLWHQATNT